MNQQNTVRNSRVGLWAALVVMLVAVAMTTAAVAPAYAAEASKQQKRPNIVVIMGDDIGQSNISAYTRGLMGYRTPNIDRIAKEGMLFTDYYAEQSCTAGRSSFITGQCVLRTGLSRVGLPAARVGLQKEDPTIAELLTATRGRCRRRARQTGGKAPGSSTSDAVPGGASGRS